MSDDSSSYQVDLVNRMLHEIFAIVATETQERGFSFAQGLVMQFLTQYIGTCVANALIGPAEIAPPGTSEAGKFTLSWGNYQEEKKRLESAIAEGFRVGWQAFEPELDPELVCQVLTVRETPSDPKISH